MPEGEQSGPAEEQVVAEREAAEDQADGEQLQRARRVDRPFEQARHGDGAPREHGQNQGGRKAEHTRAKSDIGGERK